MQEAVSQVKEALGRDAIILYTKKLRKGWIFGREIVEVAAVAEDEQPAVTASGNLRAASASRSEAARPASKPAAKPAGPPREIAVKSLVRAKPAAPVVEKPAAAAHSFAPAEPAASAGAVYAEMQKVIEPLVPERIVTGAAPAKPEVAAVSAAPAKEKASAATGADSLPVPKTESAEGSGEDLKSELAGIRQMLEQLLSKTKTNAANPWYDYLVKKEIAPGLAEQILKGFPASLAILNKNPGAIKKMLHDRLIDYIRPSGGIKVAVPGCKKVALVGPTGVGKTTTLAKLAAKFALADNVDTAFITADTYRIAAVEQLRTYATILNVPMDVVYSAGELKKCINRHKDKELVLIDTAGRSQHNEEQMDELKRLLEADDAIEAHLVLSTVTTYQDLLEIIDRFAGCFSDKVIFTKIDETRNIGNIFNIMHQFFELKISYVTNGQNVPDDIHPAEPQYLTNMLLRD
jgi:flagellar biosynthesis protein FlhF